jgi:hypothetical protein
MQSMLLLHNHKRIQFYGRVLDQNLQPVSDVKVFAAVIYNIGTEGGTVRRQTTTDAKGDFSIDGLMGRTLDIGLSKEGFRYGNDNKSFHFTELVSETERYHPDAQNPVIFRMWKLVGPEPLIEYSETLRIPNDGTFVRIDLRTGRVVTSGGDLLISIRYNQSGASKFDWSASIQAPGGGVVDVGRPFAAMFAAPREGYLPTLEIEMQANESSWRPSVQRSFYLRTQADYYGKIYLDIGPNRADPFGLATIHWGFNPKVGSRVLEPK